MLTNIYYSIKPIIPRRVQIYLRRNIVLRKRELFKDVWPIDPGAGEMPAEWKGWPDDKRFSLILTHDVDTQKGHDQCYELAQLEMELGFRSSFNFVPERYRVSQERREYLTSNGFEVGVHGLYHDGKYYKSRKIFRERAVKINRYLNNWNAVGFRSPSMQRNLEWIHDLHIEYDASTFDSDPFEPHPVGVRTIFPFWVQGNASQTGYVELPYTLPQDFTLFILMRERNIDIWKRKLDWIAEKGGMALINIHPDYINFNGKKLGLEEYPADYYKEFLEHIKSKYQGQYWHVLPQGMAHFWSKNLEK
jgi:hypothetical protein